MMKAIVTGGAGFIGSHLVDRLVADGYEVTIIDNMSCGTMDNLKQHTSNHKVKMYNADIRNVEFLNKVFDGHDVVFHLAAQANIRKSAVDHKSDLDNNLIATINILEAMALNRVPDLVFASTSALYGEATVTPTPEDYMPTQTSLYGASKFACEAYSEAFTKFAPINFWAFRFSNIIGERCRRGVIWDFVQKLNRNPKELTILGDGKQSKEYLYVKDCVDGIITGYQKAHEKINIFNLAIEENTDVNTIADMVIKQCGLSDVERKYSGGKCGWIGDNPLVHLSIEKIKALNWEPTITSREAICITANWAIAQTLAAIDNAAKKSSFIPELSVG